METTGKAPEKALAIGSEGKARRTRNTSPGDTLLRVKRSMDGVVDALAGHPDLKSSAIDLRDKVLDAFLNEERKGSV